MQLLCRLSEQNRSGRQPIGELIARLGTETLEPAESELPSEEAIDEAVRAKLLSRLLAGQSDEAEREYARMYSRTGKSTPRLCTRQPRNSMTRLNIKTPPSWRSP